MKTVQAIGVGFGLAVGFGAACVAFVMCGAAAMQASEAKPMAEPLPAHQPPERQQPLAPPMPTAVAAPATDPIPTIDPLEFRLTVATFQDSVLSECVDLAVMPSPGNEKKADEILAQLEKSVTKASGTQKPMRLKKRCDEQFAGRPVLGTCTLTKRKEGVVNMTLVSRQYSAYLVGDNDAAMSDCLGMGGDWTENSDPSVLRRARLEQHLKDAKKLIEPQ
jgi:hypothetical protein